MLVIVLFSGCQKENASLHFKTPKSKYFIPEKLARSVAGRIDINFLQGNNTLNRGGELSEEVPSRVLDDLIIVPDKYGDTALYIYNYTNDSGFVVISADVRHEPICAYIETGRFEQDTVPANFVQWFDATVENVDMLRDEQYDNTARGNYAWFELVENTNIYDSTANRIAPIEVPIDCETGWIVTQKGPLLNTQWGQGCSYNELAPNISCASTCNGRAWTGCVATAMAQVIRYWAPTNTYSYNYAGMPANSGNADVQRLMRDAGTNVNMDYGCDASGAHASAVPNGLKGNAFFGITGFGFSSATHSSYSAGSYTTVKANLDNNWPVILDGCANRRNRFLGIIYT
ncbi:MAG: hypothetical protein EOP47_29955, partial [Sphingobacteriaceae bacterium]